MKAVLIINGSFNQVANSVEEAITAASKRYRNTFWQEYEDLIEIRSLIVEPNPDKPEPNKIAIPSSFFV